MSPYDEACPTQPEVAELLVDTTVGDPSLITHVNCCSRCQAVLDRISDSQLLAEYREHSQQQHRALHLLQPPLQAGDLGSLDLYAIEEQIGQGGSGVVFKGRDHRLSRSVAVKVLYRNGSAEADARFLRESQAMAALKHDHLLDVYASGISAEGTPYIVMPLIDGVSLKQKLVTGTLTYREIAEIIYQVAQGLQAAHDAGLLHRDIKPDNILLDNQDARAKLADFGLAKFDADQTLTSTDVLAGTPAYMSPEFAQNTASRDSRCDIYSLGITLYECLTGTPPFTGQPLQILEQHVQSEPIRPSKLGRSLPLDLEKICMMAIAKEPKDRYQTAGEFAEDLKRFLDGHPVHARDANAVEKLLKWRKRNSALALSLFCLFAALSIGIVSTTSLWLQSTANAEEARNYSAKLEENRDLLRASVSQFQQRIFSGESMHWQMTEEFRNEMFGDVLGFLDLFATLEDLDEAQDKSGAAFALTQDYYNVAKAAAEVSHFEQAQEAASRALRRVRQFGFNGLDCNLLHANIIATIIDCHLEVRHPSTPEDSALLSAFAEEMELAAERAVESHPDDERAIYCALQSESYSLLTTAHPSSQQAVELYNKLTLVGKPDSIVRLEALTMAVRLSHFLFDEHPDLAFALLTQNEDMGGAIESLRNAYRSQRLPLFPSDFLHGQNQRRIAKFYFESEDPDLGRKTLEESIAKYSEAVLGSPQNRTWRIELADTLLEASERSIEAGNMEQAEQENIQCLRTYMHIRELEPENAHVGTTVIKLFIRLAELRKINGKLAGCANEFQIAAQDIRLLPKTPEFDFWRDKVRPWCIAQAVDNMDLADQENPIIVGLRARWSSVPELLKENPSDPELVMLSSLLSKELTPERPDGLRISTIVER